MRIKLAIKTLFRSPLKTLLTFLLLTAASFLLVYNVSDYALTARELERATNAAQGVLSVEYGPAAVPATADYPLFLLSDANTPANADGALPADQYRQHSLSREELDAIAALPYITSLSPRYMTAGVSSTYARTDDQDIISPLSKQFFNQTARFVMEATLEEVDSRLRYGALSTASGAGGKTYNLIIRDVAFLAGHASCLELDDPETDEGQYRIEVTATSPEFAERGGYVVVFSSAFPRTPVYYSRFYITEEQLESLVPGQRYIFAGRSEPRAIGRNINHVPFLYMGDDTLYDWWPYIYPLEGQPDNYLELDEFSPLRELIQITNDDVHTFDVVYADDLRTIRRIADGRISLSAGRMLLPEDTEAGNPVCVISETVAKAYGLELGDSFPLKLGDRLFEQYAALGAVASTRGRYAETFTEEIAFEIVGIYVDPDSSRVRENDLYWAYSDNTVFVPLSFLPVGQEALAAHTFMPAELSFVIGDAKNIRPFVDECLPQLKNMGLTVHFADGGWLSMEGSLARSKTLVASKLSAFAVTAALAMLLTVYLFIGRKRREFAIMRALGTTKQRAGRALLVPFLLLAVTAILLGAGGAALYADRTAADTLQDFTALGLSVDASLSPAFIVYGTLSQLLFLLLFALLGLRRTGRKPPLALLQENTNRNTKTQRPQHKQPIEQNGTFWTPESGTTFPTLPPLAGGQYGAARHVARYITGHARRNLTKSLLSLAMAVLLFTAMGQFTAVRQAYDTLYHTIEVKARFVNGFPFSRAQKVAEAGYVHDPYYEYTYLTGEANFTPTKILMTSQLQRVGNASSRFLDGYDAESVMTLPEKICVLPVDFMDELGLDLGDTVDLNELGYLNTLKQRNPAKSTEELMALYARRSVKCKIVGCIETNATSVVYVPAASRNFYSSLMYAITLDLAEYTLNDYHQALEFRQYAISLLHINGGITSPAFVMDTSEADNIYMIYRLIETLYPVAAAAAILIGGLLPGLIILQSAREAAILRVLGTTKKRTRAMLILEQLFLCLFGLLLAFLLLLALNGAGLLHLAAPLALYATLHFAACLLGASLAAVAVSRRKILELLQVKE